MKSHTFRSIVGAGVAIAFSGAAGALQAQDAFVWTNATELSFVSTGGNASSSTLGAKLSLIGKGGANGFKLELGGIRGETNFRTLTATGTTTDFSVTETTTSQLTAESYFARGRYDRSLGAAYTFGGAGWDRNTFAGVQNRYALVAGLGKAFVDDDASRFKADLGATYTIQKDVAPVPGADDAFGGIRLSIDAMKQLSPSTQFTSVLVADENLENSDDFRADWTNGLAVSMTDRLALKTSLQLMFDNQPSLLSVPLFDGGGVATGDNVLTPGDDLDTVLTLTLVIKL